MNFHTTKKLNNFLTNYLKYLNPYFLSYIANNLKINNLKLSSIHKNNEINRLRTSPLIPKILIIMSITS